MYVRARTIIAGTPPPPLVLPLDRWRLLSAAMSTRVVSLFDLDCYYCQVEANLNNVPLSVPAVVKQWNLIIAVNYAARPFGIERGFNGQDALARCPTLAVFEPETIGGKISLEKYRQESEKIIRGMETVLDELVSEVTGLPTPSDDRARKAQRDRFVTLERASIDEAYVDWTPLLRAARLSESLVTVHASETPTDAWARLGLGHIFPGTDETPPATVQALATGAAWTERVRAYLIAELNYVMSAGVSVNPVLAKVGAGMRKPNAQVTVFPVAAVSLLAPMKLKKISGLGGKLGRTLRTELPAECIGDVQAASLATLVRLVGDSSARWVYEVVRGRDDRPLVDRNLVQSVTAYKALGRPVATEEDLRASVLRDIATEIATRLEDQRVRHGRVPRTLAVQWFSTKEPKARGKQAPMPSPPLTGARLLDAAVTLIVSESVLPVKHLGLAASNFTEIQGGDVSVALGVTELSTDTTVCDECGKVLEKERVQEHRDFHVALQLSRQLRQSSKDKSSMAQVAEEASPPSPSTDSSPIIVTKTRRADGRAPSGPSTSSSSVSAVARPKKRAKKVKTLHGFFK